MDRSRSNPPGHGDDAMEIDSGGPSQPAAQGPLRTAEDHSDLAILIRDTPRWLSNIRTLQESDVIILLTPVVIPISQDPTDVSDPFEPLGRAIASRHARVRHIPYTRRNGITSTHLGFIKRGHIVILCFALQGKEDIPLELGDILFAVSDNKPCIIVVCCDSIDSQKELPFPTVIIVKGYSPLALEATAALLFGESETTQAANIPPGLVQDSRQPRVWQIEEWKETRDMSSVVSLWMESIGGRFIIDESTLASLLRRPGYAKHYVARREDSLVQGFCATFLSYVDQEGEKLIASVALILVRSASRNQGIGLSLHSHAVSELKRTRGVMRLQLGSTFPRILYGPPSDKTQHDEWFRRRGWQMNKALPGQGLTVHDLVLDFRDWRYAAGSSQTALQFRSATQEDMGRVLEVVDKTQTAQAKMGWYDQYLSLMNGPNVKDAVVAIDGNVIVAVALTYTPSCGSQVASNLPWAGQIGSDVGGVTCICIKANSKDEIRNGILDTSIKMLHDRGMRRVFLDGIIDGAESLVSLGFREFARFRDVWKDV